LLQFVTAVLKPHEELQTAFEKPHENVSIEKTARSIGGFRKAI
jgi:hypothetical protein